MISPKPSASFGTWRNEVVMHHANRKKAITKDTELGNRLRELKDNNGNGDNLPPAGQTIG